MHSSTQNQRLFHILPDAIVHASVLAGDAIEVGGAKISILISTDGDPEYREFPVEWFLKEVDRVEVGMETVTVARAE
ncbi:MAG: hypothetical protein IJI45_15170 [Anaerolineaceae bacterium]|nr:hypothetical protein [Anaerolineaceae bacterium]